MLIHGRSRGRTALPVAVAAAVLLSACHYVKQEDYDSAIAELRNNDAGLRRDVDANKADLASLRSELEARFQKYDSAISQLQGRVRVDVASHFDYGKAELREQDKAALDDFASVIRQHHADLLVTVEGFTDAAGTAAYNQKLGLRRAQAVRDYLVQDGLGADKVRAVSYGKARNRQVVAGAWGDKGQPNRRVALVIDDAGADSTGQSGSPPGNS